jgi:rhamnosyltransferase subunit B
VRTVLGLTRGWPKPVYELRARLGLPRGENPIFQGQHSPHLVLALFSKVLADPQPDWPPHTVVTGHVFNDSPHGTALPPELREFLDEGPPPLVFTLGSSVVLAAGSFWDESIAAVRRMGSRAVFLVGPDRSRTIQSSLPSNCLAVDRAPHSLLFPRAAAIVHQCGAGTLAQGLRSGRPVLAVPFAHDQPDNAWRAARLGTARILAPPSYRAARVADELGMLIRDPSYAAAASRVSVVVKQEGGAPAACDALERVIPGART